MNSSCDRQIICWHSELPAGEVPWQQLAQWDQAEFPWPWPLKEWTNLANGPRRYLLQWHDQAGFALWELDNMPHAYLLKILVRPQSRGQGFAKAFLNAGQQWLKNAAFSSALLEVECSNTAAVELYRQQNWQILHRIKKFYADGSDAFSMQKMFI